MREAHSQFGGRITVHPDLLNGKPTIRGKRIAVQTVLEFLAAVERQPDLGVCRKPPPDHRLERLHSISKMF